MQQISLKAFFAGMLTFISVPILVIAAIAFGTVFAYGGHHVGAPHWSGPGYEAAIDFALVMASVVAGYVAASLATGSPVMNATLSVAPWAVLGIAASVWHLDHDTPTGVLQCCMIALGGMAGGVLKSRQNALGLVIQWGAVARSVCAQLAGVISAIIVFVICNHGHVATWSPPLALMVGVFVTFFLAPAKYRRLNFALFYAVALIAAVVSFWHAASLHGVRPINWFWLLWIAVSYISARSLYKAGTKKVAASNGSA